MLLSICIPCYKRVKEVKNTLNSIYENNKDVSLDEYEVIISDNDPEKEIAGLLSEFKYKNLKYFPTSCEGFMNSYYVLTYASGEMLKLHNSQSIFRKGAIRTILDDIKNASSKKSVIFYSNGMLNQNRRMCFDDYNAFMSRLSYWSSWSNGFCIWKESFDEIKDISLNKLFPHTSLFLAQKDTQSYVINDVYLFEVQRVPKRGGHNKFAAFTIEYPSLINDAYERGSINMAVRKKIYRQIMVEMLPTLIFNKYIARIECFEIDGYHKNIKKYFPWYAYYLTFILSVFVPFNKMFNRFKRK